MMLVMARSRAGIAIQTRMREVGHTQLTLGKALRRSQTWISQSLLDDTERTIRRLLVDAPEALQALLGALEWTPDEFSAATGLPLLPITDDTAELDSSDLRLGGRTIPVYDLISAGHGADGGTVIDTIDIPDNWQGQHAAYVVTGDSMAPAIPDGAKVIIRCQDYASPGNLIVCYTPETGMVVKLLKDITPEGEYALVSLNPAYRPVWATEVHIMGVVREIRVGVEIINGNHN